MNVSPPLHRVRQLALCLALAAAFSVLLRPLSPAMAMPAGAGDTVLTLLAAELCSATGTQPTGDDTNGSPSHCLLCFAPAPNLIAAAAVVVPSPSAGGVFLRPQPHRAEPELPVPASYSPRAPPAV